ncbi:MAG: GNAT family N-acetyltransferase [Acidimicrobiales bacterium]
MPSRWPSISAEHPPGGAAVHDVRLASPADLPALERALGLAFADDPVWSFALRPARRLPERIGTFSGIVARIHLSHGSVWVTKDGSAAAIWGPPKLWRVEPRQFLRYGLRAARAAGPRSLPTLAAVGEVEKHHPSGEHWYLAVLGTEPSAQGQGRGSALLRPMLERCDLDGLGAYLESSKESNIAFYARHGFEVTESFDLPRGGPRLWSMWRDPRPPDGVSS